MRFRNGLSPAPSYNRPHGGTIFDYLSGAFLFVLTAVHIIVVLEERSLSFTSTSLFIVSAALNLAGLIIAVTYQRPVFTITFFFTLFFFSLAPLQQLLGFFDPLMEDASILDRALAFCLIFSIFCFATLLILGPAIRIENAAVPIKIHPFSASACLLLFGLLCAAITIGLVAFGRDLFTDRTVYSNFIQSESSQPVYLLYSGALRPFTIYGSVVGLWLAWSHRRIGWCVAFGATLCGGLILANPLVTPRFEVATLIYTIIFYFGGRGRCRMLVFLLILGIVLAPLFNLFRAENSSVGFAELSLFLVSSDFDAFSLLCHTIWHVDYHGLDYGNNVLSAIFFFVPRTLWPSKNEITPYYLIDSLQPYRGLWNTNLSEPLVAEGYFAFGLAGVIIISFIYAWFARYLEQNAGENRLNPIYLFCCAAPPLLFVLLRGSLIIGISVIVGNLIAIILATRVATLGYKYRSAPRRRLLSQPGYAQHNSQFSPPT